MTCIVGVEYKNTVLIGGDIQGTGGNNKVIHTQPKVFNKSGVVFGYTSSYRFGQLIEHALEEPIVPDNITDIYRWLTSVLVPKLHISMKSGWYVDGDSPEGGNCLIGVKNQLWELQEDWSVLRSVRGYMAVGSGCEYALGSMLTSMESLNLKTREHYVEAVKRAVYAAGTFSPSVGTDCTVMSTDKGTFE